MVTLVTGATGFVGSAVLRQLLARGERCRALARRGSVRGNLAGLDVEVAEGDLNDEDSLKRALKGCNALYHVAADYRLWVRDPDVMMRTNVEGSRNLMRLAAAAGVRRAVYTSSVAVIRPHGDGTLADEETPSGSADMIGPYKLSKFRAERAVLSAAADNGLEIVTVNPSTPIGPRDIKPTPTGRIVVESANGRMPAYVETGLNVVHVDDVARGHLLAFDHGQNGERYILGGENLMLSEILAQIAELCGRRPPSVQLPLRAIMPIARFAEALAGLGMIREPFATVDGVRMAQKVMFFSSDKARRELGYVPRPAHQALTDALEWFRRQGHVRA